jgi:hypothetical protein
MKFSLTEFVALTLNLVYIECFVQSLLLKISFVFMSIPIIFSSDAPFCQRAFAQWTFSLYELLEFVFSLYLRHSALAVYKHTYLYFRMKCWWNSCDTVIRLNDIHSIEVSWICIWLNLTFMPRYLSLNQSVSLSLNQIFQVIQLINIWQLIRWHFPNQHFVDGHFIQLILMAYVFSCIFFFLLNALKAIQHLSKWN